jgi:Ser/Thr protein kinase RdoA (MazF antagonist)
MMSVAAGRPPSLSKFETSALLVEHFSFRAVDDVSIKPFPSYRDRNCFFRGDHKTSAADAYVFKLSNPMSTSLDVMDGVNQVMKHLNSSNLLSPYPLASHGGNDLVQLSRVELKKDGYTENQLSKDTILTRAEPKDDQNTMKYPVYVLSYIPGQIFDHVDKQCLTPALLHEIGELLGKIDKELMVRLHYFSQLCYSGSWRGSDKGCKNRAQ